MDPAALLADLDADQRRAVTTESSLVAVIAGAGSGKTRVLTRRIAHRVAIGSADAAHTIALTFTREAGGELRRRLVQLGVQDRITAGTFHAVANQLLRQRWADRDQRPRTIVDDRSRIIASLAPVAGRVTGPGLDALVDTVAFATARGMSAAAVPGAIRRGDVRSGHDPGFVADVLVAYAEEKRRRGVVDLDDLLSMTIEALEHDAQFADTVRWRFRHVHVDEAQDLNPLQHRLVDLLRAGRDDVFLVGDPAQSIYGFTGSDPALLTDVGDRFPGVEVIRLPTNHRSTPQVVATGRHVLANAGVAVGVQSARADGPTIAVFAHDSETAEAAAVTKAISLADPGLVRNGRVAVLARTHAALTPVRRALVAAGVAIQVRISGAGSDIGGLLAEGYRIREPDALRRWIRDLHDLADESDESDESDGKRQVADAAVDFLRAHPTGDGQALRAWVAATDPFAASEHGVELLTFHAAKGREWHTVHLVGCETGLVPHRSATTAEGRAEEARLLYVAVTRATDVLSIHWSRRRGGYQRRISPLLDGFSPEEPEYLPPPVELVSSGRNARDLALDHLHVWRADAARASGILPDALVSDRVLALIAEHRPRSAAELDRVTGIGAITASRLYDGIATALSD